MKNKPIDIICIGETLVDLIGNKLADSICDTSNFSKFVGGSPTNVAINMAQLGFKVTLISSIGKDGLGDFIKQKLNRTNIDTQFIALRSHESTSLILVSRSQNTPNFIPYRQADMHINLDQIPDTLLDKTSIFHTTCFALSLEPARSTILKKAKIAYQKGCKLSIDLNYTQKIWGNTIILPLLKIYCQYNPLIKLSDDDAFRIFKKELSNQQIFGFLHDFGADLICLTKGNQGAFVSKKDENVIFMPAPNIKKVKNITGAGDAFWSGFLMGYLKELSINSCLKMANRLAKLKIQHLGGIPENTKIMDILEDKKTI